MNIRKATGADSEAVREVHRESIEGLGPQSYDQEQVKAWAIGCESADYTSAIESSDLYYIVAKNDGEYLGFGSLLLEAPDGYEENVDAEITGIYVSPSAAREKIGTALLANIEQEARDHEFQTLGLTASLNAVPFYEYHGYEQVKRHNREFSDHESTGVEGVVIEMFKPITS